MIRIIFESKLLKDKKIVRKCDSCDYRDSQFKFIDLKCPECLSDYTHCVEPIELLSESKEYYNAIYEVQSQIRNKIKWDNLTEREDKALEWISGLIIKELDERNLKHYWSE